MFVYRQYVYHYHPKTVSVTEKLILILRSDLDEVGTKCNELWGVTIFSPNLIQTCDFSS